MRSVLAAFAGVVVGGLVVAIVEGTGHALFPLPDDIDPTNPESIQAAMDRIPLGSMLFVILAWAVGTVCGSVAAARLTAPTGHRTRSGLIVGGVLMLGGLMNLIAIPSPLWFWMAGLAVFPVAAFAGTLLVAKLWPEAS